MTQSLSPIRPDNPGDLGFPPQLATELAMGLNSVREICDSYGLDRKGLEQLIENPIFKAEFEAAMAIRGKEGGLFTLKARLMAEDALEVQYKLMNDTDAPPAIRLKAAENLIEASGRMPKASGAPLGSGMHISINLGGGLAAQAGATVAAVAVTAPTPHPHRIEDADE